jgi:hypothetical protein
MKLLISFWLLLPTLSHARVIVMSFASGQEVEAQRLVDVMQNEHHIPGDFIELVASTEPCRQTRSQVSWHLCINENGDLHEVAVDTRFIQETLRVFL